MAQASADTTTTSRQTTFLLPDGSVLPPDKFDSLEQAWGKGRIRFRHNAADDVNGTMRLERITDDMKKVSDAEDMRSKEITDSMLNKAAPDFQLADMQGKSWSLKELRGKIIVLNFWFTSCAPCIREMPDLNELKKTYVGKEVIFLGLTYNTKAEVKQFIQKRSFNYILLPDSHKVDALYKINSWPTSMVINKKGDIKAIIVNSKPDIRDELQAVINTLL